MPRKFAYAKINLGLHVLGRRTDGYHDIETVMVRIGWADEIRIDARPDDLITLTTSDPILPTNERNTCVVAAVLLKRRFNVESGVHIELDKKVPYGAGLGSGSSDAAAVLTLLRDLWKLECSNDELESVAADVGSDVPFFVRGTPAMATGRGTRLASLNCNGTRYQLPFPVVIAVPNVHVSTREAYSVVATSGDHRPSLPDVVCTNEPSDWGSHLVNDFEAPLRARLPEIDRVFRVFEDHPAEFVSLSGSGSAVFALFRSLDDANAAVKDERFAGMRTWCGFAV